MCTKLCTKIVTIVANRGKSKSSLKQIQRQDKIAFFGFISNQYKTGNNYLDLEAGRR